MNIGQKKLEKYKSIYIIAEIGSNHDKDLNRAKKLISLAKDCGADAAKFQSFNTTTLLSRNAFEAKQGFQRNWKKSVWDTYYANEMPREWHFELADYSKSLGIHFFTSPWDSESIDLLNKVGSPAIKIGSGDIDNFDLLYKAGEAKIPIFLGTGASSISEVAAAVEVIQSSGNEQIILMHCVVNYPSDINQANVRVLPTLEQSFGLPVGYSDHSPGDLIPITSVSLGAVAIEKHFTDDRSREGPDHQHSMEPKEFSEMVSKIRTLQNALGSGLKNPVIDEKETRVIQRRSIYTTRIIRAGEKISRESVCLLRPASGIPAKYLQLVIGRIAKCDLEKGQVVQWLHI